MIKGIERRVVEMKLTDNKFYERACLVLKVGEKIGASNEQELIEEARRIVSQIGTSKKSKRRFSVWWFVFAALFFCAGAFTGILATFLIK
jgi:hypothetical protein